MIKKKILAGFLAAAMLGTYPAFAATYQGIDVSKWQPDYDFAKAKRDGVQVVYLRSSLAEHTKDKSFDRHYSEAKKAGLKVGAYHFFYDGGDYTVEENLKNAVAATKGKTFDCRYVIDVEGGGIKGNVSKDKLTADVLKFADEFTDKTGIPCGIYASTYFVRERFTNGITKLPLWVADYRGKSSGLLENSLYKSFAGWQYADNGAYGNCLVDSDYFYDDMLIGKTGSLAPTKPADKSSGTSVTYKTYKVKRGDCLYTIGKKSGVNWRTIASLNGIKSPYLLHIGQVLKLSGTAAKSSKAVKSTVKAYTVKRGDCLYNIAKKYGKSYKTIAAENGIKAPYLIHPGQKLKIK